MTTRRMGFVRRARGWKAKDLFMASLWRYNFDGRSFCDYDIMATTNPRYRSGVSPRV